ncbi:MAG: N-acetyltransferase family protein [Alphaproteobacteria bacterium]
MTVTIRTLTGADAPAFRALRMQALAAHPEAFGNAPEDEAATPIAETARWLDGDPVFAAVEGDRILGVAGFVAERKVKLRHKGTLWGMYVRPEARRQGIAGRLIDAVLDHARGRVESVHLKVAGSNSGARRLYERKGFAAYGLEPNALKLDDRYEDEVMMARAV